jgi:hypothetical protein
VLDNLYKPWEVNIFDLDIPTEVSAKQETRAIIGALENSG